jgi:hypothetical protein
MTKSKKTNKKFYNKWLYKVTLNLDGAGIFRIYTLDAIENLCLGKSIVKYIPAWIEDDVNKNKKIINDIAQELKTYDTKQWAKRIERKNLDLYTNDPVFFKSIMQRFDDLVVQAFEPDENYKDQLEINGTILGKKLPHNRYRFRVYLLPHKMAEDVDSKLRFISWIKGQNSRITCTNAVEKWYIATNWNWDRRYVLVEDEQTLMMLKLRGGDVIGKVYNYQVYDK